MVRLEAAYASLIDGHEILRTTWHEGADGLYMRVHGALHFELQAQRVDPEEIDEIRADFVARLHREAFDLEQGPMLRAGVLSAGPDEALLVTVMHQLVADDASFARLFDVLGEAYAERVEGQDLAQPLPVKVEEVEERHDEGAACAYWGALLHDRALRTPLPTLPEGHGALSRSLRRPLGEVLQGQLQSYADRMESSLFEVIAALWVGFLRRWTGQEEIAFAYPVDLRPQGTQSALGFAENLLPMVVDAAGLSLSALVYRVRDARREAR